jgi:hypothetical protein
MAIGQHGGRLISESYPASPQLPTVRTFKGDNPCIYNCLEMKNEDHENPSANGRSNANSV